MSGEDPAGTFVLPISKEMVSAWSLARGGRVCTM